MKYIAGIMIFVLSVANCYQEELNIAIDMERFTANSFLIKPSLDKISKPQDILDALKEFIKGFWYGITYTYGYDARYFRWCYKSPSIILQIVKKLPEAWEKLKKDLNFSKFLETVKDVKTNSTGELVPCYVVYDLIDHFKDLIELFIQFDADDLQDRLINTLLMNLQLVINDVTTLFGCISEGDFHCIGAILGQLLYVAIFH